MGIRIDPAEYARWVEKGLIRPNNPQVVIGKPEAIAKKRKPRKATAKKYPGPAVTLVVPCRVVSEMNRRDHWATRRRRFDAQANALRLAALFAGWRDGEDLVWPFGFPVAVTCVHVGPEMDDDNIRSAFKAIRDAVASWAGVDDRDPAIEWRYAQRVGPAGVEVTIERKR